MSRLIIETTQRGTFESAHFLEDRQGRSEYEDLHGHSYICEVTIIGYRGHDTGWLIDHAIFNEAIKQVTEQLCHKKLNDVEGLETPTAENLAVWIANKLQRWIAVSGFEAQRIKITKVTIFRENIWQRCTYRPLMKEVEK